MELSRQLPEVNEVAQFEGILILARHHWEPKQYLPAWQLSAMLRVEFRVRSSEFGVGSSWRRLDNPRPETRNPKLILPMAKSLFEKVWNAHTVGTLANGQTQLLV